MKSVNTNLGYYLNKQYKGQPISVILNEKLKLKQQDINHFERKIERTKKEIQEISSEMNTILKYMEKYPDLKVDDGVYCSSLIEKDITACRVFTRYNSLDISFSKQFDENSKYRIFLYPHRIEVANIITSPYDYATRAYSYAIKVLNYDKIISNENPVKKDAIRKIKKAVIRLATKQKYNIHEDSYDYEYFRNSLVFA